MHWKLIRSKYVFEDYDMGLAKHRLVVMARNHHHLVIWCVDRGFVQPISMNLLPGTLQMGQVSGMVFSTVLPQTGQM